MWAWTRSRVWCQIGRRPSSLFVRAEGRFGLGQLDVGLPEVLGRPVAQVGSQEVAAFRKHRPLTPLLFFRPRHLQAGTTVTFDCIHTNVEQARRATVLTQQTADLSLHLCAVRLFLGLAQSIDQLRQALFDAFLEACMHCLFLCPSSLATAEDERFLSRGARANLHLQTRSEWWPRLTTAHLRVGGAAIEPTDRLSPTSSTAPIRDKHHQIPVNARRLPLGLGPRLSAVRDQR